MDSTFNKSSISISTSSKMLIAAMEKAEELGFSISACIVDESGNEKAFARMDGAPLISIEASRKKAVLAVGFGMPTGDSWQNFVQGDPILEKGVHDLPGFILLGGGIPIFVNGQLVGGIGISGGHYKMDEKCANAAIEAIV
jgi:uncharacterized protein GlcG (DUF336 family)